MTLIMSIFDFSFVMTDGRVAKVKVGRFFFLYASRRHVADPKILMSLMTGICAGKGVVPSSLLMARMRPCNSCVGLRRYHME